MLVSSLGKSSCCPGLRIALLNADFPYDWIHLLLEEVVRAVGVKGSFIREEPRRKCDLGTLFS